MCLTNEALRHGDVYGGVDIRENNLQGYYI
jgi:hypothetical protein